MAVELNNTQRAFQYQTTPALVRSYWLFRLIQKPRLVWLGGWITRCALALRLPIEPLIRWTVFRQFCGGTSLDECVGLVKRLDPYGVGTILDYAVEASRSENTLDANLDELSKTVALAARDKARVPFSVFKPTALIRSDLLEKKSAGQPLSAEESAAWERGTGRFNGLCDAAHKADVRLFVDAEESWIQPAIDSLAEAAMARLNRKQPIVFHTLQMYRTDRMAYLENLIETSQRAGFVLGLKLVRGAYMEKERRHASEQGRPSPIHPDKQATDAAYDRAVTLCLQHPERVHFCAATHNEASSRKLADRISVAGHEPNDSQVWFSQLFGMSDHLTFNLAAAGFRVAKYVPYGPVREVVPYLLRRAQENTSVAGQTNRELELIRKELQRRRESTPQISS